MLRKYLKWIILIIVNISGRGDKDVAAIAGIFKK